MWGFLQLKFIYLYDQVGTTEDVANQIVHLASNEKSRMVSGLSLVIDGGLCCKDVTK